MRTNNHPGSARRRQNNANLSYRKSRLLWSMDRTVCVSVWSRFANGLHDDVTMKLTFHTAIVPVLRCQAAWVTAPWFDHMIKLKKKNCLGFLGFHVCLWVIDLEEKNWATHDTYIYLRMPLYSPFLLNTRILDTRMFNKSRHVRYSNELCVDVGMLYFMSQ